MSRVTDFLRDRKRAYQFAFTNKRIVAGLKEAYLEFKGSPAGNLVLSDLARFCRATSTTWSDDARHHARLEGRREVWLRITEHMHLTTEQLQALYDQRNILSPSNEDTDNA
jgi:hypothetical protein